MKAIGYVRVSTEKQSYERQVSDIKDHCRKFDLELLEDQIFSEKESGRKDERKELTAMFKYLNQHPEVDNVVVAEISRLGRTTEVLNTINKLNEKKVCLRILAPQQIITLDKNKNVDPNAQLLTTILTAISGYELTTMKSRMKSGLREKRINGVANGSNYQPYGYYKEEKTKLLKIDDEESKVVIEIFDMYLSGLGTKKIANILNERGTLNRTAKNDLLGLSKSTTPSLNRGQWVDGSINFLLRNTIYIGKRRHAVERLKGFERKYEYENLNQPQLEFVDKDIFKAVQDRLKSNVSKQNNFKVNDYLLDTKKIICGCCKDQPYYSRRRQQMIEGKVTFVDNKYVCLSTRSKGLSCGNGSIPIDKTERLVQSVILSKYSDILKNELDSDELKNEIQQYEDELVILNKDLKKEVQTEINLMTMYAKLGSSDEVYLPAIKPIQQAQENLRNLIKLTEDKQSLAKINYDNILDISKISYDFNSRGGRLPKKIVNTILSSVHVLSIEKSTNRHKEIKRQLRIKGYFTQDNDKLFIITLQFGMKKLQYIMSQREDYIFDLQENMIRYIIYVKTVDGYNKKIRSLVDMNRANSNLGFEVFTRHIDLVD
jgi:site-specific DNA recombinase